MNFLFIENQATPLLLNPNYIHCKSSHPTSITKQLQSMTSRHTSSLSCNDNEFYKAKPLYKLALKYSGFNYSIKFEAPLENARQTEMVKSYGSIHRIF